MNDLKRRILDIGVALTLRESQIVQLSADLVSLKNQVQAIGKQTTEVDESLELLVAQIESALKMKDVPPYVREIINSLKEKAR